MDLFYAQLSWTFLLTIFYNQALFSPLILTESTWSALHHSRQVDTRMKERCLQQHRMGETCGAKLVHHESVMKREQECNICQSIAIKRRKLKKQGDKIVRWRGDGTTFSVSIEKAEA